MVFGFTPVLLFFLDFGENTTFWAFLCERGFSFFNAYIKRGGFLTRGYFSRGGF